MYYDTYGEIINTSANAKSPGGITDNELSWKDHIWYISGKLARDMCDTES